MDDSSVNNYRMIENSNMMTQNMGWNQKTESNSYQTFLSNEFDRNRKMKIWK